MFVYRKYDVTDIYNDRHQGYEVGFFYWDCDYNSGKVKPKFNSVKSFVSEQDAAEYCHWLNGGACYKYDNDRLSTDGEVKL